MEYRGKNKAIFIYIYIYIYIRKIMKRFNYDDFKDELMKALQGVKGKFSR